MNWDEWKKIWKQSLQLFLALALAIAFYFLLLRFYSFKRNIGTVINILMPFIYGGVMAYLLKTPCNFFDKFWEAFLPAKWKNTKPESPYSLCGFWYLSYYIPCCEPLFRR